MKKIIIFLIMIFLLVPSVFGALAKPTTCFDNYADGNFSTTISDYNLTAGSIEGDTSKLLEDFNEGTYWTSTPNGDATVSTDSHYWNCTSNTGSCSLNSADAVNYAGWDTCVDMQLQMNGDTTSNMMFGMDTDQTLNNGLNPSGGLINGIFSRNGLLYHASDAWDSDSGFNPADGVWFNMTLCVGANAAAGATIWYNANTVSKADIAFAFPMDIMLLTSVDGLNARFIALYPFNTGCPGVPPLTPIAYTTTSLNNTRARVTDVVQIGNELTDDFGISMVIFAWNNTGPWVNVSNTSVQPVGITTLNYTVNLSVTATAGKIIGMQFFANQTEDGVWSGSIISTFQVAGTTAPSITINAANFFEDDNSSILGATRLGDLQLDFTLTDDIDLYGFEFDIRNNTGGSIYSFTNITMTGTSQTFQRSINLSTNATGGGFYTVNITSWDTHTAKEIPDYKINKGSNYITFDDEITITAEGAVDSKVDKKTDSYTFEFDFPTGLSKKTFYLESDGDLDYQMDSNYRGHFVDWKNKKWIDFEGSPGGLTITKLNKKKYKVVLSNSNDKIKLKSIGGLNSLTELYKFYVVSSVVDWVTPITTTTAFINGSIYFSLNVTSQGRNQTEFRVYNSSNVIIRGINVTDVGTGSFIYYGQFDNLTSTRYYVNATHYDSVGGSKDSETLTFDYISINNCTKSGNKTLNISLFDEDITTNQLLGSVELSGRYWLAGSPLQYQNITLNLNGSSSYPICIHPIDQQIQIDMYIRYAVDGGFTQRWFLTNASMTNTTQLLKLYNFDSTTGISELDGILRDSNYNYFPLIISKLQRYYIGEDVWRTVQMDRSDDFGQIVFNIYEKIIDYRVLFEKDYRQIDSTNPMKFICTAGICELTFIVEEFDSVTTSLITYSSGYNNASEMYQLNWTDSTGLTSSVRLLMSGHTGTIVNTICDTTVLSSSGTINCNTTGYYGTLTAEIFQGQSPLIPKFVEYLTKIRDTFFSISGIGKNEAGFWSVGISSLFIMGGALTGGAPGALIAYVVSLFFIFMLKMVSFVTIPFITMVAVVSVIIAWLMGDKK